MKKILIAVSSLVFLLVVTAIVIPLVVDVDQYRPEITKMVNEKINGKFELGRLKLSLWGQIHVDVAGLKLQDLSGRKIVKVENAYFHLPFLSVLSGTPVLTFKMKKPEIAVVKDKNGKLNILSLMKQNTGTVPGVPGASNTTTATSAAPPTDTAFKLPGIVTKARLGIEILEASFAYSDAALGSKPQAIRDLNLVVRDISLTRTMNLELWANLESKVEQGQNAQKSSISVRGPFKVTAQAEPKLENAKLESLRLVFKADFDNVEVMMPGLFEKKKGVSANASGALQTSFTEAKIESFDVRFHHAELKASGSVTQVSTTPQVDFKIKSNEISFKPWSELVPLLKEFELGGTANFSASVKGEASKLNYQAELDVQKVTAKSPLLKSQPEINGKVKVMTDQIESLVFSMKAPGNEIQMNGKLVSFTAPRLTFQISSTGMDLDQLVVFPPVKKAEASSSSTGGGTDKSSENKPENKKDEKVVTDYDSLLDPLRSNKMAQAIAAQVSVNLAFIKVHGMKMENIVSKISWRDLVGAIDSFSMGIFDGVIKADASVDLKPKAPQYRFSTDVKGLDLKQAVSSQMPLLKNTLLGIAFFKVSGAGASFNPDFAKKNLNAKGNMKVEKATFATIDVGKMVSDALSHTVAKLGDKIPQIKGRKFGVGAGKESRYESISSDFVISGGKFSAPNFVAKAEPKQGVDIKGNTVVGISDLSLKTEWEILDTYNFTHARDLSIEQVGVKVDHLLAEGDKPVRFPVSVNCTLMAPCYTYTEVPEFLGKIALNNVNQAVQGKAKAELKKRAEEEAKKLVEQAPPALKDKVGDIRKKLFGR